MATTENVTEAIRYLEGYAEDLDRTDFPVTPFRRDPSSASYFFDDIPIGWKETDLARSSKNGFCDMVERVRDLVYPDWKQALWLSHRGSDDGG